MLLHKWEKGQLQISLQVGPPLSFHGRYSTSSIPPIPKINIDGTGSSSIVPPNWQTFNTSQGLTPPTSSHSSDSTMDANLARYLNQGRRHTLGTAHNTIILEEINRLRKINESSSSQASSGFGSSSTHVPPVHPEVGSTLSTNNEDPKNSIGSLATGSSSSSSRQFLRIPRLPRRFSDGGHYLEAYRQFLQKRTVPMYVQQHSVVETTSTGQPSAKQLLQEKIETDRIYGRLPPRQKLPCNPHLLSSSGLESSNIIAQMVPLTSSTLPLTQGLPSANLQEQCRPFIDITQQQIREKLEQLHMSSSGGGDGPTSSGESSNSSINSRRSSQGNPILSHLLSTTPPLGHTFPQTPSSTTNYMEPIDGTNSRRYSFQPQPPLPVYPPSSRHHRNTLPELHPQLIIVEAPPTNNYGPTSSSSAIGIEYEGAVSPESSLGMSPLGSYINHGSPSSFERPSQFMNESGEEKHRRVGVALTTQQHAQITAETMSQNFNPQDMSTNPATTATTVQQIPVFFEQHISLLNPTVASQIAQQQMTSLVSHISSVLNKYNIMYQCNGSVFTIGHRGVELQIHVQVSPHFTLQNALQLNLQYMHISGDSRLYQSLCAELAPHFVPSSVQ